MKEENFVLRLFKGALIGVGAILPGLSAGVLAVIFGVYERLIHFLSHLKEDFFKELSYFIPIGIGAGIGIIFFSFLVAKAFGSYAPLFTSLFVGFLAGTFPSLYKEAGKKGRSVKDFVIMFMTIIILYVLMVYGDRFFTEIQPSPIVWFLSGAIMGIDIILPGTSPSNFLIYFGLYQKMSEAISHLDFTVILPIGIGGVLLVLLLSKAADWALEKHYSTMHHLILGTVAGSSLAILPTTVFPAFNPTELQAMHLSFGLAAFLSLLAFVIGALFSVWFSKIEERVKAQQN